MSYSNRLPPTKYTWPQQTLTGSNLTFYIQGPKGKGGTLYDYGMFNVQTTFAGASNTPQMEVGVSGTLAAYGGLYDFLTLAIAAGMKSIRSTYRPVKPDKTNFDLYLKGVAIPADTLIVVTVIVATGGGAAGAAQPFVEIVWDD